MSNHQNNFTLLSHGKQVDRTEEEVLHREPPFHLQAQRGFITSSPNGRPSDKKPVTDSLDMTAAYITFECSFISIEIRITST